MQHECNSSSGNSRVSTHLLSNLIRFYTTVMMRFHSQVKELKPQNGCCRAHMNSDTYLPFHMFCFELYSLIYTQYRWAYYLNLIHILHSWDPGVLLSSQLYKQREWKGDTKSQFWCLEYEVVPSISDTPKQWKTWNTNNLIPRLPNLFAFSVQH